MEWMKLNVLSLFLHDYKTVDHNRCYRIQILRLHVTSEYLPKVLHKESFIEIENTGERIKLEVMIMFAARAN